jgi:hypothetical protein
MALAASLYGLPPRVLPSIQAVEGGTVGAVHRNANGTEDLGVMQVNTIWLGPLSVYTHLPPEVVRNRLLAEPCFNTAAAAAILRAYLIAAQGDLMLAIGDYHSQTPRLNQAYQLLVLGAATRLFIRGR